MIACDPKMAAFAIAGALSWIGRWYRPEGPDTPDRIADQFIQLLAMGLCSAKGGNQKRTSRKPSRPGAQATPG